MHTYLGFVSHKPQTSCLSKAWTMAVISSAKWRVLCSRSRGFGISLSQTGHCTSASAASCLAL